MNLSSLFIVCSHGRRSAHKLYEKTYTHITGWCPGGRPANLEDIEGLGEKVWNCSWTGRNFHIPPEDVDILDCLRRSGGHLTCGYKLLIPLPQLIAGKSL